MKLGREKIWEEVALGHAPKPPSDIHRSRRLHDVHRRRVWAESSASSDSECNIVDFLQGLWIRMHQHAPPAPSPRGRAGLAGAAVVAQRCATFDGHAV